MQNFDNKEAINGADYLFGGRKAKARKAAKKVMKAEKALEKGNVRKAERKLTKAVKKTGKAAQSKQAELSGKISATTAKVQERKQNLQNLKDEIQAQPVSSAPVTNNGINILPIEPVAQESQNYPDLSGITGNIAPTSQISGGGGGGGYEEPETMPLDEIQDEWNEDAQEEAETEQKKTFPVWLIIAGLALAGFLIFKK